MSEKVTCFGPLLLKSLYVDPDLAHRFRPRFFFKKHVFPGPGKRKRVVLTPGKGRPMQRYFRPKKHVPSDTENYRPGTPTNTIIEGVRDVAMVAASSPPVLASRQRTFADKLG